MISLTGFLVSIVLSAVIYFLFKRNGKNYPDGPFAYPLIGNTFQLGVDSHKTLLEWTKIYGDVFKIHLGPEPAFVVADLKTLRDVLNDPKLNARPTNEALELVRSGPHGVVMSSGHEWVEQRRFTLRHLRDFGFGKSAGEELIMTEVNELLSTLKKSAGTPCSLDRTFQVAILNTLWMITSGNRYAHDDPQLWSVFNGIQEISKKMSKTPMMLFFPSVAKLFPNFSGWNVLVELTAEMCGIIGGYIDEHKKTFPEDGVPRDYIDAYLKEINKTTDVSSSFYESAGVRSLTGTMADFFLAGSDTVTTTLQWAILYICKYPEMQKKLQDELDSVVGRNRNPTLADRSRLPYVEATLSEVSRIASIVPLGLNRCAEEDGKIQGFDCPKGTFIIGNLYAIHHNEKYFPEPENFKPERFLSSDGKTFIKHDAVLPFGSGKRVCLGETLARDELFLYFTNMFHRFNIRLSDESKDVSLTPVTRFLLVPKDYEVVLTVRD